MIRISYLLLLLPTSVMATSGNKEPQQTAVEFNHWYLSQVELNIEPNYTSREMKKYVTTATREKLQRITDQEQQSGDALYDADFFIKSQYVDDDWSEKVTVLSADRDPVCLTVKIAFGAKQAHVVADCMVFENGLWKIESVTNIK